jgi:hypothetical protein
MTGTVGYLQRSSGSESVNLVAIHWVVPKSVAHLRTLMRRDRSRWVSQLLGWGHEVIAIVAVARKLAVLLLRLRVTGGTYYPLYNVAIDPVIP